MEERLDNTQEKQSEKLVKGNILIMDIQAIPRDHGMDIDQWTYLLSQRGILFYDGERGNTPTFQSEDTSIKMYDIQEEENMKELEQELANLEGPLEPILQPEQPTPNPDITLNDNMSGSLSNLIVGGGSIQFEGTAPTQYITTTGPGNHITVNDNYSDGTQVSFIGGHSADVVSSVSVNEVIPNPIATPITPEETEEFLANWNAGAIAPIVYGTGGETVMTNGGFENDANWNVQDGIATRNEVAVVGSPLTDNEIEQLEIVDPRGQDALAPSPEQEETAMIDAVMNATPRETRRTFPSGTTTRRVRARRQASPGFNLTDDLP